MLADPAKDDNAGILKEESHFRSQALKNYEGGNKAGSALNMEVIGHNDLGARGFNADVWTHEGYAYIGHWGFTDWATGNSRFCPSAPNNGVAVVDARNPSNPTRVATLQNPEITDPTGPTQVSDWGVQDASGPWIDGQGCDPDANYGHGAEPSDDGTEVFLSYWDSGFIRLDLTNRAQPVFVGRTVYPSDADGDGHSSQYDEGGSF